MGLVCWSGWQVRLHDRSKPWDYDYPDLVSMISRASYFLNATDGTTHPSVLPRTDPGGSYYMGRRRAA